LQQFSQTNARFNLRPSPNKNVRGLNKSERARDTKSTEKGRNRPETNIFATIKTQEAKSRDSWYKVAQKPRKSYQKQPTFKQSLEKLTRDIFHCA
jgi:hypothetical protein